MKTRTETASDQLLGGNREKQKKNICSPAAIQTVLFSPGSCLSVFTGKS